MASHKPLISVIIPVRNNLSGLELCLDALERQSYPVHLLEVLCIDDGSDSAVKLSRDFNINVSIYHQAPTGSYAARNLGIGKAHGEILAFTDSDCIPTPSWLEQGVQALQAQQAENCGIVGGRVKFTFAQTESPTIAELYDSTTFMQQATLIARHQFAVTANLFTKPCVFDQVGLFDGRLQSGGDGEWGNRVNAAGYSIYYAENSTILHPARKDISAIRIKWLRVINGFEDIRQLNGNNVLYHYKKAKFLLFPPLQKSYCKVKQDARLDTTLKKLKVFCMCIYVHYVCELELSRRHRARQ